MPRILTGVQSTGTSHLGNILGAILLGIQLSEHAENDSFLFVADMHALTKIKDGNEMHEKSRSLSTK